MRSARPKVLHELAGRSMLAHVLSTVREGATGDIAVVVGPDGDGVAAEALKAAPEAKIVIQRERRGTADAVLAARDQIERGYDDILVLYADIPLIEASTLASDAYGARFGRGSRGAGIRGRRSSRLWPPHRARRTLDRDPGAQGRERRRARLTLVQRRARSPSAAPRRSTCSTRSSRTTPRTNITSPTSSKSPTLEGSRPRRWSQRKRRSWASTTGRSLPPPRRRCRIGLRRRAMAAGATLTAPETVFLSFDAKIGRDVLIEPHVVIGPGCSIEDGAVIRRLLPSRGRAGRGRRGRRAVRATEAGSGHRDQGENRQFR